MICGSAVCDAYGEGRWLRRWSLVGGHARCTEDAYEVSATDPAVLDAQRAANAGVRQQLAAVEAYEAALDLAGREEPPAAIGGDEGPVPNPAWQAWNQARTTVAEAGVDVIALHGMRTGEVP